MEGILKAYLVADRLCTEPVATGPATAVCQSEMYATATSGPVLIGPVQSGFGLFSGPIDRTFKHYPPLSLNMVVPSYPVEAASSKPPKIFI